jgi:LysM repeat protein
MPIAAINFVKSFRSWKVRIIKRPVKRTPRKRLRASAQRSAPKHADDEYSSDEPNVKLSRAFVVVLLLHVVAVGGIFAFSSLKDRQNGAANAKAEAGPTKPALASATVQENVTAPKTNPKPAPLDVQKLIDSSGQVPGSKTTATQSKTTASDQAPETGRSYIVQGGDNPARIAKKFKVNYADLLKANNIDDPKKLKIGQKLIIPGK